MNWPDIDHTVNFFKGRVLDILVQARCGEGPSALEEESLRRRVYNLDGDPSDHIHPDCRTDAIWEKALNQMWDDGLVQILEGFKKPSRGRLKATRLLWATKCGQMYLDSALLRDSLNGERTIYR